MPDKHPKEHRDAHKQLHGASMAERSPREQRAYVKGIEDELDRIEADRKERSAAAGRHAERLDAQNRPYPDRDAEAALKAHLERLRAQYGR